MRDITIIASELLLALQLMLGQNPLNPPKTVSVEPAQLQQRVCGRACKVWAWYSPEGTIYIDRRLDVEHDLMARSILVHELSHHIQRMSTGKRSENCGEWLRREREAFLIQAKWLAAAGAGSWSVMRQRNLVRCNAGAFRK